MRIGRLVLTGWTLLAVALPVAAQTTLGVRAGVGIARMDLHDGVYTAPCPPNEVCLGFPTNPARSVTFGVDLAVPLAVDPLEVRVGGTYAVKGGVRPGRDANGEPLSRRISASYFQLSSLLGVRLRGRPLDRLSVRVLAGPWVALRLWCDAEGRQSTNCAGIDPRPPDAGVALGGGLEVGFSTRLSLGVEAIYYHGLTSVSSVQTTRFVAIQAGAAVPVG